MALVISSLLLLASIYTWLGNAYASLTIFEYPIPTFFIGAATFLLLVIVILARYRLLLRHKYSQVFTDISWALWTIFSLCFFIDLTFYWHMVVVDRSVDAPPFPRESSEFFWAFWSKFYLKVFVVGLVLFTPPMIYLLRRIKIKLNGRV